MTINSSDFHIQQKGVAKKGNAFGSHKYTRKAVLRYELGIDMEGPYPAGAWPDIKKILNSLVCHLLLGGCIVADNGYVGHPNKIKCPNNDCNPERNLGMQSVARSHHETFNGRLKNWGILERTYRIDIKMHGLVFSACAVITQLCIANGEPLFEVEYGDALGYNEE